MLLPGGTRAICRFPVQDISLSELQGQNPGTDFRLATLGEVFEANQGAPFPWGYYPDDSKAARLWKDRRVGYGGLIHSAWFITQDGRVGGAPNVPSLGQGALRNCLLLDGGHGLSENVEDNEGLAVVRATTSDDQMMYRRVQLHAARHVVADRGSIIVSPIGEDGTIQFGFVGRCQTCPNPELISGPQLQQVLPNYQFQLWDEWENWRL